MVLYKTLRWGKVLFYKVYTAYILTIIPLCRYLALPLSVPHTGVVNSARIWWKMSLCHFDHKPFNIPESCAVWFMRLKLLLAKSVTLVRVLCCRTTVLNILSIVVTTRTVQDLQPAGMCPTPSLQPSTWLLSFAGEKWPRVAVLWPDS